MNQSVLRDFQWIVDTRLENKSFLNAVILTKHKASVYLYVGMKILLYMNRHMPVANSYCMWSGRRNKHCQPQVWQCNELQFIYPGGEVSIVPEMVVCL